MKRQKSMDAMETRCKTARAAAMACLLRSECRRCYWCSCDRAGVGVVKPPHLEATPRLYSLDPLATNFLYF